MLTALAITITAMAVDPPKPPHPYYAACFYASRAGLPVYGWLNIPMQPVTGYQLTCIDAPPVLGEAPPEHEWTALVEFDGAAPSWNCQPPEWNPAIQQLRDAALRDLEPGIYSCWVGKVADHEGVRFSSSVRMVQKFAVPPHPDIPEVPSLETAR